MKPACGTTHRYSFETASRTHVGLLREINEDRILAQPHVGLWAVADGMGGHSLGDRAASAVVSALSDISPKAPSEQLIQAALQTANASILEMGRLAAVTCGSTVAGLSISEEAAFVFWAGDSRVYQLRGGELSRLTHDHSFVQELRDAGVLNDIQVRTDPRSNIITRAIGIVDSVTVDFASADLRCQDLFLICSDGLSDLVDDTVMKTLLDPSRIEESANNLILASLAGGGTDNISLTIIVLR